MKKSNPDTKDDALFQQAMQGVKPIAQPNKVTHQKKPKRLSTIRKKFINDEPKPLAEDTPTESVTHDETLSFSQAGLQTLQLRKLKRGQIPCEASLDLHRLIIKEAEIEVAQFLEQAQEQALRCVIIIHGKGYSAKTAKPILKNKVNRWLRCHPAVLAFCSALPKDGGTGALYVLLKR